VTAIRVHLPGKPLFPAVGADRSYVIRCGSGLLGEIGPAVREAGGRRAAVVCDAAVAGSHAARVQAALHQAGVDVVTFEVPSGEPAKSIAGVARLWDAFAGAAIDRGTHVVAVGGGVVGDLAGFVAATFTRGLPLWHVPTTLVAQVDSAIGGKTGINLEGGKNLAGAFWQPLGVFSDVDTLATLPRREFVSGFAEVVKYGVIFDAELFGWLEDNAAGLLAREPGLLTHAIGRSAALKAAVVERDERETSGERAALNYGHTFAHALEAAAGYGSLLHGEAVAIGMAQAARLACRIGRIDAALVARQDAVISAFGLPTTSVAVESIPADQLLPLMARDKKTLGGRLRFVLPTRLGHVEIVDDVPPEAVLATLRG
jgi:3-dehydroquinate synthase